MKNRYSSRSSDMIFVIGGMIKEDSQGCGCLFMVAVAIFSWFAIVRSSGNREREREVFSLKIDSVAVILGDLLVKYPNHCPVPLSTSEMEELLLSEPPDTIDTPSISYPYLLCGIDRSNAEDIFVSGCVFRESIDRRNSYTYDRISILSTINSLVFYERTSPSSQLYVDPRSNQTRTFYSHAFDVWVVNMNTRDVTASECIAAERLPSSVTERRRTGSSLSDHPELRERSNRQEDRLDAWLGSLSIQAEDGQ